MNLSYLFAAFAVVWIGVLGYVVSLSRRNRDLEHDLEDLRSVLEQRETRDRG